MLPSFSSRVARTVEHTDEHEKVAERRHQSPASPPASPSSHHRRRWVATSSLAPVTNVMSALTGSMGMTSRSAPTSLMQTSTEGATGNREAAPLHQQVTNSTTHRLLSRMPSPICLVDSQARVLYGNAAFNTLLGVPLDTSFLDTIAEHDRPRMNAALSAVATDPSQTVFDCLTYIVTEGDARRESLYEWTLTREDDLDIGGIMVVGTRVKASNYRAPNSSPSSSLPPLEDTSHTAHSAEYDSRVREAVRNLNHEIRSPLSVAIGAMSMLMKEYSFDSGAMELVDAIGSSLSDAQAAVDDSVPVARGSSGRGEFRRETSVIMAKENCLVKLVHRVVTTLAVEASTRHVSLRFERSEVSTLLAVYDEGKMQRCLRELLLHILTTAQQGDVFTVGLRSSTTMGRIEFTSHSLRPVDTSGFDQTLLEVNNTVKLQGGTMGFSTSREGFLVYYLELPLAAAPEPDSKPAGPGGMESIPEADSGIARVLVVDDSALCRKILIRRIKVDTVICYEANDGVEAVAMYEGALRQGLTYSAIVMDNTMPNLTGPLATKRIRELGYKGKVFGVSGNVLDDDIDDFIRKGANAVYPKPLNEANFKIIMEAVADATR